jgi:hypothetical protein
LANVVHPLPDAMAGRWIPAFAPSEERGLVYRADAPNITIPFAEDSSLMVKPPAQVLKKSGSHSRD